MIPGDIDLTKNLDFRRRVKKEIPQLPSEWNKNGNNKKSYNNFDTNITVNSDLTTYTTSFSINTSSINRWSVDVLDLTNYNIIDDYDTINLYNDYRITVSNTNGTTSTYRFGHDKITWKLNYIENKPKKDVFGNIVKEPEPIPKIPWGKIYPNNPSKSIAWRTSIYHDRLYENRYNYGYYDNRIPWDVEYIDTVEGGFRFKEEEDIFDKAKKMICWLNDKSISFIKSYLDYDDGRDLSYLTNMSWIRIRDAIIE